MVIIKEFQLQLDSNNYIILLKGGYEYRGEIKLG